MKMKGFVLILSFLCAAEVCLASQVVYDHVCDISRPCGRNGRCIKDAVGFGYRCQCDPEYGGRHCQQHQPCECLNGGSCYPGLPHCDCPFPYTGDHCETNAFPPSTAPDIRPEDLKYLGCYDDAGWNNRALSNVFYDARPHIDWSRWKDMSYIVIICAKELLKSGNGNAVFSVQDWGECRTDSDPDHYKSYSASSNCHSHVGGPMTNAVYRLPNHIVRSVPEPDQGNKRVARDVKADEEAKEIKQLCEENKLKAKSIFSDDSLTEEKWNSLHPAIKAVLTDVVANDDHKMLWSTHAQIKKAMAGNDLKKMSRIMAKRSMWKRVPLARFWKRKELLKKAVKNPWSSLAKNESC